MIKMVSVKTIIVINIPIAFLFLLTLAQSILQVAPGARFANMGPFY